MDKLDRAIIDQLQDHGRLTNQELADRVGLTPAPCLRRVRRLEAEGVITGYTALVNPAALGRDFEVITTQIWWPKTLPRLRLSRSAWWRWTKSPS